MKIQVLLGIAILALFGESPQAWGNAPFRPQFKDELSLATADSFVRLKNAEVAWANFEALRRDFPVLRGQSDAEVRHWILKNFAYVTKRQLKLQGIRNTSFEVEALDSKEGWRSSYIYEPGTSTWKTESRRAADLEGLHNGEIVGLVNIKGNGNGSDRHVEGDVQRFQTVRDNSDLDQIRTADHSDGLMSLGEAIAEVTRQSAVQRLFDLMEPSRERFYETVESYFIITAKDLRILKKGGESIPAALYGRQAHWGRSQGALGAQVPWEIYEDHHGGSQSDYFRCSVDFGGVLVRDSRLMKNFGPADENIYNRDPQKSKPWVWGHDAAKAYDRGDKDAVYRHLREMLSPLDQDWNTKPRKYFKLFESADIDALSSEPEIWFSIYSALRSQNSPKEKAVTVSRGIKALASKNYSNLRTGFILSTVPPRERRDFLKALDPLARLIFLQYLLDVDFANINSAKDMIDQMGQNIESPEQLLIKAIREKTSPPDLSEDAKAKEVEFYKKIAANLKKEVATFPRAAFKAILLNAIDMLYYKKPYLYQTDPFEEFIQSCENDSETLVKEKADRILAKTRLAKIRCETLIKF